MPGGLRGGRSWIVAAAILWSMSGLFAKAPTFADWPAETRGPLLAFWRALFAGLLIMPAVRQPRWKWQLVPLALTFTAMNLCYLTAMTMTTAANAIWLQSAAPFWVMLWGLCSGGERPARSDIAPLALSGLGVGLILCYEATGESRTGIAFGMASGVFYAAVVMQLRNLRSENSAWLITVNHLVAAALLLPFVIYKAMWPSLTQLPVLAAFGLLQMGLPYVFFAKGLQTATSQEATGIGLLEPLLLPIWVYLVWHEEPAWWTVVGGGLILVSLLLRLRR
jgi:drug/metabolite transporter, DME family